MPHSNELREGPQESVNSKRSRAGQEGHRAKISRDYKSITNCHACLKNFISLNQMEVRMKMPDECCGLNDVRLEIDNIDKEIVNLLKRRLDYVLTASRFKKNEEDIPAPDRVKSMLVERRAWARESGLAEDFIENLFEQITAWYIATQIAHWRKMRALEGEKSDG